MGQRERRRGGRGREGEGVEGERRGDRVGGKEKQEEREGIDE